MKDEQQEDEKQTEGVNQWRASLADQIDDDDFQLSQVEVRIVDVAWFYYRDKSVFEFAKTLNEIDKEVLNDTDLVVALLEVYWLKFKSKIIKKQFVYYVIYLFLSQIYMVSVLSKDEVCKSTTGVRLVGAAIIMLLCYLLYNEYQQFMTLKKKYFGFMNILDLFQYLSNFLLIINANLPDENHFMSDKSMRLLSSAVIFNLFFKMFDWLRMFDTASKYVSLIMYTILDIMPFFGIFFLFLIMSGSAFSIINE